MHAMVQQVPLPGNSISPGTRARWRRWLERNHRDSRGVWVVVRRKDAAANALAIDVAADEALCFGWLQQRSRALDDVRRLAWMSPRPKRSGWTRAQKEAVRRLEREGRMAPAGIASVKAAKREGTWSLLDEVESLVVPEDLARALDAHHSASNFARLAPSARRHALEWIRSAKRPATRAARVEETARLAGMDIVMTQWRLDSRR
jgi:uncharacterized protein YdeI (YjbR/CyaY-like superfamily)